MVSSHRSGPIRLQVARREISRADRMGRLVAKLNERLSRNFWNAEFRPDNRGSLRLDRHSARLRAGILNERGRIGRVTPLLRGLSSSSRFSFLPFSSQFTGSSVQLKIQRPSRRTLAKIQQLFPGCSLRFFYRGRSGLFAKLFLSRLHGLGVKDGKEYPLSSLLTTLNGFCLLQRRNPRVFVQTSVGSGFKSFWRRGGMEWTEASWVNGICWL